MLIYVSYSNIRGHVADHTLLYHYFRLIIGFPVSNYNICNLCSKLENGFYQWFYIIILVCLYLCPTQILYSAYYYYYYLSVLFVVYSNPNLRIDTLCFRSCFDSFVVLYYLNFIWWIIMIHCYFHPSFLISCFTIFNPFFFNLSSFHLFFS